MNLDWITFLLPALCCLFTLALGILGAVMGYLRSQTRNAAWQELATRNGLQFEPGGFMTYPRLSGVYRGHSLLLTNFRRTHGRRNSTTYTRLTLSLDNRANIQFGLYGENMLSGLGKAFGMQDVRIGDETVDRRFVIQSQPEQFAAALFASAGLRERLLQTRSLYLTVKGSELIGQEIGMLTEAEYLQFLFDLLADVAERVDTVHE